MTTPTKAEASAALVQLAIAVRFAKHGIKMREDEAAETEAAMAVLREFVMGDKE
jgi:hypothetical protein